MSCRGCPTVERQCCYHVTTGSCLFSLTPPLTGPLCGACSNGTSVSALLDNCVHCTAANATLIVALSTYANYSIMHVWTHTHAPPTQPLSPPVQS